MLDLGVAGVIVPEEWNVLVQQACITYVRMNFGQPDEYDRFKRSYDEQKAQLVTCTGFASPSGRLISAAEAGTFFRLSSRT